MTRLELPPVVRFAAVGAANSLIDFGVFTLAHLGLAVALVPANVIAYAVAATFSEFANSRWTFGSRNAARGPRDFVIFQLVNLVGLVLATTVLVLLARHMPVLLAKLFAVAVSFAWSFNMLNRLVWPARGE
ncbi:MAG TPA: GtrA family protein [Hyphomicrobiales bacterium]|nr:GtrA family protein [Hyphomicrobiales bacterium]